MSSFSSVFINKRQVEEPSAQVYFIESELISPMRNSVNEVNFTWFLQLCYEVSQWAQQCSFQAIFPSAAYDWSVCTILFTSLKRLVVLSNMLTKFWHKWHLSAQTILLSINVNSSDDHKYFPLFHDWENLSCHVSCNGRVKIICYFEYQWFIFSFLCSWVIFPSIRYLVHNQLL